MRDTGKSEPHTTRSGPSAAAMAAFIKKGDAQSYETPASAERTMHFEPGMVFDSLVPGEDIGTIDSNRPNPNAVSWRDASTRAARGYRGGGQVRPGAL